MINDDTIEFLIEVPNGQWMAFGFGTSMTGADLFLCKDFEVTDRYSYGWSTPGLDFTQDYTLIESDFNLTHSHY